MKQFIKISFTIFLPLCLIIFCVNSLLLGQNTMFTIKEINGLNFYCFDPMNYFNNITLTMTKFTEQVTTIVDFNVFNWDNVINSMKSVCNIIICILNLLTMPFTFIGKSVSLIFSLLGVPYGNDNWLSSLLYSFSSFALPYLTF